MMFDLLVFLARYVFVGIVVLFLLLGVRYIWGERGYAQVNLKQTAMFQTFCIFVFNILAFFILAYSPQKTPFPFDVPVLLNGLFALVFFLFGWISTQKLYQNSCPLMWNGLFFLVCVSFVNLQRLNPSLVSKQMVFAFVGFLVMLLIPTVLKIIPKFEKLEILYLFFALGLLVFVFFGATEVFGAKNWVSLFGVGFQPSEFAKVLFVFYLACAFKQNISTQKFVFVSAASAVLVVMLVAQKDLGGALIFFMTFMIVMYAAMGNDVLFFLGLAGASAASYLAYTVFPHVRTRVEVWQNPWADIDFTGYQLTQSLFAITTWGPMGSGLGKGYAAYIPVVERDFIFSAICEEFGGLFGLLLIFVYLMVFYRGMHIALRCKNRLHSLLSVGLTGILAFQTFVILGGDIKLIPMTGVTLPFVSYGGSSVFICIIMLGVLEWIYTSETIVV